jgi:hypothetical protein
MRPGRRDISASFGILRKWSHRLPHVPNEDLADGGGCFAALAGGDLEVAAVDAQLELHPILLRDQRVLVQRLEKAVDVAHGRGIRIGRVTRKRFVDELVRWRRRLFHPDRCSRQPGAILDGLPTLVFCNRIRRNVAGGVCKARSRSDGGDGCHR